MVKASRKIRERKMIKVGAPSDFRAQRCLGSLKINQARAYPRTEMSRMTKERGIKYRYPIMRAKWLNTPPRSQILFLFWACEPGGVVVMSVEFFVGAIHESPLPLSFSWLSEEGSNGERYVGFPFMKRTLHVSLCKKQVLKR